MVQCFVPDCNHQSEAQDCSFFRFPGCQKERKRWEKLIRRGDKGPTSSSRVCSCHFRDGKKVNLPTVFKRNAGKIFEEQEPVKRKPKATTKVLQENSPKQVQVPNHCTDDANNVDRPTRPDEKVLLQIELDSVKRELEKERAGNSYHRERYSVKNLSDDVVRMETGLPNKQIFNSCCLRSSFRRFFELLRRMESRLPRSRRPDLYGTNESPTELHESSFSTAF